MSARWWRLQLVELLALHVLCISGDPDMGKLINDAMEELAKKCGEANDMGCAGGGLGGKTCCEGLVCLPFHPNLTGMCKTLEQNPYPNYLKHVRSYSLHIQAYITPIHTSPRYSHPYTPPHITSNPYILPTCITCTHNLLLCLLIYQKFDQDGKLSNAPIALLMLFPM
jgi:hypothetical protein